MDNDNSHEAIPAASGAEHSDHAARTSRGRRLVLYGTLAVLLVALVASRLQQRRLESLARPLAQNLAVENSDPGLEVVADVTVSQDAILFGPVRAKVEVFVREAGLGNDAGIRGIEYRYALEDGEWRLTESGSCTDEACALRGRKAFEEL